MTFMKFKQITQFFILTGLILGGLSASSQVVKLNDYSNSNSATIGTYLGVSFREAGFSGLFPIAGTNGTEFWTCSDRGVNVDCGNANPSTCRPTYDKLYCFPSYAPKIHRIRIIGNEVQILQTISIKRPNGTGATGIINPTGFGSTSTEVATTDTVLNCANFNLKTYPKDTFGIDPEGILVDKEGNFWLCEEGGATIWKLNRNGVLIARFTPYANLPGAQSVDIQIDTVFKYRKNNRGFEGITIAPNGKIYAIIQSPILFPTTAVGEASRVHRILEIDPITNQQHMFIYLNDGIIGSGSNQIRLKDWKIGDMAAINDSTFLVLEAAARGTTDIKRLYQININQATVVTSGLYSGLTLEALVDSAGLAAKGVKTVTKTLVMDLLANGWPAALDKAEGLAIINDSTIAICNDNDFGQTCPNADGIPVATTNSSHVITFGLQGNNKLKNYKALTHSFNQGVTGKSSSQIPYIASDNKEVELTSILTVGDVANNNYQMIGIPDGLGTYDNGNGTFTLVMNHELGNAVGGIRAHGSKGAFVSKWVIDKNDLSVIKGEDLIKKVNIWQNGSYTTYDSSSANAATAFSRFCSADLPKVSSFYNASSGLGTQERIFMTGEESGAEGRAFGHIVTGANAGTSYELPTLGNMSYENVMAHPNTGDKTVVAVTDDATPGQVYMYIGTKTNSGSEIDKAGLSNGKLYGIAVSGLSTEVSTSFIAPKSAFTMVDLGSVKDSTGAAINTMSNAKGVTAFLRPEDGSWDPSNPNDFYFVTTNSFTAPSRMYRLHFSDINDFTKGGEITAVLDGTEGQKMLDNMTIDNYGHALLQEDPGNNVHIAKIWQYTIATDKLELLAYHNPDRFIAGGADYLTQDEESSGIIDLEEILGAGNFLFVQQAHYNNGTTLVEGGQLLNIFNPTTANAANTIAVSGNTVKINNGETTTSSANNTLFPATGLGKTAARSFVISNDGKGDLYINNITIAGVNAADFKLKGTYNFPVTIAAKTTASFTIEYTPNTVGNKTAVVEIVSNNPEARNYSFAIGGSTLVAAITVTGNNQNINDGETTTNANTNTDFGTVELRKSVTKDFVIRSSGTDALTISNITFTGANSSEFSIENAIDFPWTIPTGTTRTVSVKFTPTSLGQKAGVLNIANTDGNKSNFDFALTANGIPSGINDLAKSIHLKVYPNTADREVKISFNSDASNLELTLYDAIGNKVKTANYSDLNNGENIIALRTEEFSNGLYFIQLVLNGQTTTVQLIIRH
jgi:hypothetical protein